MWLFLSCTGVADIGMSRHMSGPGVGLLEFSHSRVTFKLLSLNVNYDVHEIQVSNMFILINVDRPGS